jgi:Bacterial Ig-like domain (group 3)
MIETEEFAGLSFDSRPLARRQMKRRAVFLALAAGALLFSLVAAQGTTITVNSDADAGGICPGASCTLRQAIATALPGDTIDFASGITTINLTSAELAINKDLTITGPGANLLTVQRSTASGTPKFRIFHIVVGNLTMAGLTIANGSADSGVSGGGILNSSGTLTIESCIISRNSGGDGCGGGGGVSNSSGGTVNMTKSTVAGNSGGSTSPVGVCGGGGILNLDGTMNITDSTLSGNSGGNFNGVSAGGGGGGGLRNNSGTVTFLNCTISGNSGGAQGGGGGIYNSSGGTVNLTNSTVSTNRGFGWTLSAGGTGGILNIGGTMTIINSTISGNSGTFGGISNESSGTVKARNSIIAKNTRPTDIPSDFGGTLTSEGYNLIGDTGNMTITGTTIGNQLNVDPNLGPLQDNGGPTFTHALLPGSTAIDGGDSSGVDTDQRGFNRPVDSEAIPNATGGDSSDIGAFEKQAQTITFGALAGKTYGDPPFTVSAIASSGLPVAFQILSGPATISGDTVTINGGGTVTVRASQEGDGNYNAAPPVDQSFIVARINQSITFGALTDKTYGDPAFDLSATASSGLPVAFQIVSGPATVSGNTLTIIGGGIVTVEALQEGDSNYNAAIPVEQSFAVAKANQSILFDAPPGKTYGDQFDLSATASSGLPVAFQIVSGPATVSGSTVTINGVGTVTVRALQEGDDNYNAAPIVDQSFSVAKASSIVVVSSTLNPSEKGENVAFKADVSVNAGTSTGTVQFKDNGTNLGSPQSLDAMSSASYSTSSLSVGTHVITAEYSGDSNVSNSTGTLIPAQMVRAAPTLANMATRLDVGTFDNVLIAGFIIEGTAPKKVMIRGIGPSLKDFGITNTLANPQLELHDSTSTIGLNDNWQTTQVGGVIAGDQTQAIQDSGLAPTDGLESAMIATLSPGTYTAIVRGVDDTTGVGLVELYDLSEPRSPARLANISTRGVVQPDDQVMIGGVIIVKQPTKVVIRAIGPSLHRSGISNALSNPQLELHDAADTIATNDNWQTTQVGGVITSDQTAELLDSHLAPDDPAESAMIVTLQPGSYTAVVKGVNATSGVGLVEFFALP